MNLAVKFVIERRLEPNGDLTGSKTAHKPLERQKQTFSKNRMKLSSAHIDCRNKNWKATTRQERAWSRNWSSAKGSRRFRSSFDCCTTRAS
eukprot:3017596-Pleurochrysis_carterae.AAC.1